MDEFLLWGVCLVGWELGWGCLGFVFFSDGGSGGGGLGVGVWGGVVWVYCDGGCDAEEGEGGGEDFFHWFCLCFVGVFFSLIVVRM